MSTESIKNFITSTQETYNKYGDEVARYDARSDPFNMYNRYSFLGTLMDKLAPYPIMSKTQLSGFSLLSNLLLYQPVCLEIPLVHYIAVHHFSP